MDLILASTSRYRKSLLERLQLPFRTIAPGITEEALPGETPEAMSRRLALAKARAVAELEPGSLVVGSDQVASLAGSIMGKPGNRENAAAQLARSSGQSVSFHTGLALLHGQRQLEIVTSVPFRVHFRDLDSGQIERYLEREQPYDCAGSFKCEGLGIALFERMEGDDPTALEGLPLIALTSALSDAGLEVL